RCRASARGPAADQARGRCAQHQECEVQVMAETIKSLEDLGTSTVAAAQPAAPVHVQKLDAQGRAYATGKRKNAIARVWVKPGNGKITVNGKDFDVFFARPVLQMVLQQPIV